MLGLSGYIGYKIKPTEVVNNNVNIICKTKDGNNTIYKDTTKGFHGLITSNITVSDKKIININITNEQETYWQSIVDNDYLNKLITGQDNINNVDTISGATVSSTALKDMVEYILNDIESSGNK
jgi:uncharacterized protein with FMN-binding domain